MPILETMLARAPRFVLTHAEELGLERRAMLRGSGLSETELSDPDSRIQVRKWLDLWRFIAASTGDPDVGLRLGSRLGVREVGLLGYLMQHSATLGGALDRFARFFELWRESRAPRYRLAADRVEIGWSARLLSPLLERAVSDWMLSGLLSVLRGVTGRDLTPLEVQVPYARADHDLGAVRRFFAAPLRFQSPVGQLVLRRSDLDVPIQTADIELGRYLEQHATHILEGMVPGADVTGKVQRALWEGLKAGEVSLEEIASRLAMSPRTLQRRLNDESTSFSELRDEFRHEMANQLLGETELSIYEVAFLLGYSEPSTFYRAFRRWEGASPLQFRLAS